MAAERICASGLARFLPAACGHDPCTGSKSGTLGRFRPALPFSRNELKECGFHADPLALSAPSVSAEEWEDMCNAIGRNAAELRQNFLEETAGGRLTLQPSFRTQQDILRRVADGVLARLLCDLATHVLFIADFAKHRRFLTRQLGVAC